MFAAVALAVAAATASTGLRNVRYDAPPPDFAIPARQGSERLSELHGKAVVLNFWASWCKPCTDELKYFVRANQAFGPKIAVITVSSEPHDVAASYLRLWNIELPVVEDLDGAISKEYSVPPIPVTVVLDPQGNVSYVSVGGLDWNELRNAIDSALGTQTLRVLR